MKKVKCLRLTLDVLNPCGGWVGSNHSQRFEFFLKRHLLAIVKLCVTIFRPLDRFAFLVFADPPLPPPLAICPTANFCNLLDYLPKCEIKWEGFVWAADGIISASSFAALPLNEECSEKTIQIVQLRLISQQIHTEKFQLWATSALKASF